MVEPADFYIYALFRMDRNEPFYVGKGRGDRLHDHLKYPHRGENRHKANIIRKCAREGVGIEARKIHEGLTEHAAYSAEIEEIARIGRRPNGPLVNRTAGGEGFRGLKRSKAHKDAIAKALGGKKKQGRALEAALRNAELARLAHAKRAPESRQEAYRKGLRAKPPEKRSDWQRRAWETRCANDPEHENRMAEFGRASMTPEKRARAVLAAAAQGPELRSERVRKANAARTPEQKRAAMQKAWATRRANKDVESDE